MKFKSIASPLPSAGVKFVGKKIVIPNQALSLKEILERFTRGEPLEIGRDTTWDDGEDDLEKVAASDLVDKEEFVDRMKEVSTKYQKQEKSKAAKLAAEREKKAVDQIAADKLAAEKAAEKKDAK